MSRFETRSSRADARPVDAPYRWVRLAYVALSVSMFAAFVLVILVHVTLAGGQVGALDRQMWPALVSWPVIPVAAPVVVAIAIVGAALGCVVAAMATVRQAAEIGWLAALAVGLTFVPLFMGGWFPAADGIVMPWFSDGLRMGWHALGAPFGVVALVVLQVRGAVLRRRRVREIGVGR